MRQTRWSPFGNPWNPLQRFQSEMNRLFDRWSGERLPGLGGYPALNVWEDGEHCFVEAELPGVELKDLEILVTGGNQLTLKGQRRQPEPGKGAWHRQERPFGNFSRTLTLPFHVDAEKVQARLENGVLSIQLAKHESAKPRKITIKAE
jgi:HSP20 family protein